MSPRLRPGGVICPPLRASGACAGSAPIVAAHAQSAARPAGRSSAAACGRARCCGAPPARASRLAGLPLVVARGAALLLAPPAGGVARYARLGSPSSLCLPLPWAVSWCAVTACSVSVSSPVHSPTVPRRGSPTLAAKAEGGGSLRAGAPETPARASSCYRSLECGCENAAEAGARPPPQVGSLTGVINVGKHTLNKIDKVASRNDTG